MSKQAERGAVFVDDSGQRAVVTTVGMRVLIAGLATGLTAVLASFLIGVPLPGLSSPVALPSGGHGRPQAAVAAAPGVTLEGSGPLPRPVRPTSSISAVVPVAAALGGTAGAHTGAAALARPATAGSLSARPSGSASSYPATTSGPPAPTSSPVPSASPSHGSPSRTAPPGKSGASHSPHTTPPARG